MERMLQPLQPLIGVTGRVLLGLYFVIPGVSKILAFDGTGQYMATHGVHSDFSITAHHHHASGWRRCSSHRWLADPSRRFDAGGMTLVINVFMHDFWNVYEGLSQQHETQNFIKNLAIMAGLLTLTAGPAVQSLSLDNRASTLKV